MTDESAREIDHTLVETVARALAKSAGHVPHRIDMRWRYYADMAKDAIIAYLAALEAGGFAVVPKVPTQDMRVAGVGALATSFKPEADRLRALPKQDMPPAWIVISVVSSQNTDPVWSAMLAASNPKEEGR